MATPTLFSDYLTVLGVPHTAAYSDMRFRAYPARHTMTAMQDLLAEYGVLSRVDKVTDTTDLSRLTSPAVVSGAEGFMIVRSAGPDAVECMAKGGGVCRWHPRNSAVCGKARC